jgi:hypothetical protein
MLARIEAKVGKLVGFKGRGYFRVEPADWVWLMLVPSVNPSGLAFGGPEGWGKTMSDALADLWNVLNDPTKISTAGVSLPNEAKPSSSGI